MSAGADPHDLHELTQNHQKGAETVVAQPWKRPELADQPDLKKLNDELHDLRLDAGLPSARTIRDRVGKDAQDYWIVNHQAVLDTFQKPDRPPWGRLEVIVHVLAEVGGHDDVDGEVSRFKGMWKQVVRETVTQASVQPPADSASADDDDVDDTAAPSEDSPKQDTKDSGGQAAEDPPTGRETPSSRERATAQFNYAEESLKGLILNAAQALWYDKDALRVFLGVVRRSDGFSRMADAAEERRPANATFYGVRSREFEVPISPARLELVTLHRRLDEHRLKRKWSFTDMENQTGVSSDAWIRWYTHDELPERDALVAFSHMAGLQMEDHVLLLGLWDAARAALEAQKRSDVLPPSISFDEAWSMRDPAATRMWALAGVGGAGGEDLTTYGPDLASGTVPAFAVAGPPGAGRSTALVTMARSLLASGTQVVLAAPRPSPLRELADRDGVVACFDQENIGHDEFEEALSGASPQEPIVALMDDAEVLGECDARRVLRNLLEHGFDEGTALVLAGDEGKLRPHYPWLDKAKKAHRGLLLSPQERHAGDRIGIKTGDSVVGRPIAPGRGWLHLGDGNLLAVAVPC
ncbi:ATP-binding protein [Streptomyces sp. NPDC047917]|uniref:ATP-binding protein n=1 Tax=Streptomyces sp. NPDC047917 TaxID=3365491 RepID=UPI003710CBFB